MSSGPGASQTTVVIACILAGTAVALGAWAAHGLESALTPVYGEESRTVFGREIRATEKYTGDFRTGVTYQMWHALALLATARWTSAAAKLGRASLILGTVVFSGSLYALALTGVAKLGAITPVGGLLILVGWGAMTAAAIISSKKPLEESTGKV